jgi:hypothetical protein
LEGRQQEPGTRHHNLMMNPGPQDEQWGRYCAGTRDDGVNPPPGKLELAATDTVIHAIPRRVGYGIALPECGEWIELT